MKKRTLTLELTDEEAEVFDAVRFLHGNTHAMNQAALVWLHRAGLDTEIQRLVRERGSRLRRTIRHLKSVG